MGSGRHNEKEGAKAMGSRDKKKQPLFTKGEGQKQLKGESLWNKEGIKNFRVQRRSGRRSTMMRRI